MSAFAADVAVVGRPDTRTGVDPQVKRHRIRHARLHHSRISVVLWLLLVTVGVMWWEFLAPAQFGGPSSYVIVVGQSMEPLLHTGDMALARERGSYGLGDLVVFDVESGSVIHRIVGGSAEQGWLMKGDNNSWIDPWRVADSDIDGQYTATIPRAGSALSWLFSHPFAFGALAAVATAVGFIPLHRRRIHPLLARALVTARKEPAGDQRTRSDYAMLALALTAATVTYAATLLLILRGTFGLAGAVIVVALAASSGLTLWLLYRVFDGLGVPEPRHSLLALSGDLYRVDTCPDVPGPLLSVESSRELRSVADRFRLPVLHHVHPVDGEHTFAVITPSDGTYCWVPARHDAGAHPIHSCESTLAGAHVAEHAAPHAARHGRKE